ncbi:MAG: hypothetical protein U5K71_00985 [Gracilimonas sp.]|nr:hypothetical protein [Gracilimonas sp.]
MKSFFIWLLATLLGAALGFGLSWLIGMNLYLYVGVGIILGNSAGITANIYRGRESTEFDSDPEIESTAYDSETSVEKQKASSSSKTNQKAS